MKNRKVAVTTLGCKVNQFESASFLSGFREQGCELVSAFEEADILVVNTCAVTARAGQQSRQLIRRLRRSNPAARLVVTGCYAQLTGDELPELLADSALVVIGNADKHLLVSTALAEEGGVPPVKDVGVAQEICPLPVRRFSGRTRAYLRIQDGCNNFCSYCIVPYTRGRCRSLPLADVLAQVEAFVEEGYQELVITGINVGKYGLDLAEGEDIYSLLEILCHRFPTIRIRLSSVEPAEVNDRLLSLMAEFANFMPHLHIPLQSGENGVLARMHRKYTTETFAEVVEQVRTVLPHAAIGCDILAGFPGENEEAAEKSISFLAELPITYLHIFPYSLRPGTEAAKYADQVPGPVKDARVARLRGLDAQKRRAFYQQHCGMEQRVLFEGLDEQTGLLKGFSENYIPVRCQGRAHVVGSVMSVRLIEVRDKVVFGERINP
ncbi:MAG: tRNA (N(6)-L-threonylcarbamoyladenosine(37)-C(2))-methylthiotransferase MtaB [Candidatus Electrothrix sp. GW3-4]|uniref:tRNA (N(6)-L-threonylcarbamoyladenosine(37)-C(2))- methylthiotransferase MtaB n=1 Tax=Candidatus Electrothrix sp. GW3-4 TaxID=3126740 RepID=UPI0030CF98A4